MKWQCYQRIILAAWITLGLLMVPFAAPAMAKASPAVSSMEMSGDMPCCPEGADHKLPQNSDCKDCLMLICALKNIQALPFDESRAVFERGLFARVDASNDILADDLVGSPPARPPRS